MKKIIYSLGILVFVFSVFIGCVSSFYMAARENNMFNSGGYKGDFDGEGAHIGEYSGRKKNIIIPAKFGGYPLKSITNTFAGKQLTSVVIPQGVTLIGSRAFTNNQLTSVVIPQGVTKIGEDAFSHNQLASIVIPQGVTVIGNYAFSHNQLASVDIPQGVTVIDKFAFFSNQLTSVTIPQGITKIGPQAFAANPLTQIIISGNIDPNNISYNSLGSLWGPFITLGGLAGIYTKSGTDWYRNGELLPNVGEVKLLASGFTNILSIDGKSALDYFAGLDKGRNLYIVLPGSHTVEVSYSDYSKRSQGSVTFEHQYLFEGRTYLVDGTEKGDQILFRIGPLNDE